MGEFTGPGLLRECLERLEWAPERLAREINKTANKEVVSPKAPYHWLQGGTPRGTLPELAALTLSRALGEHVTPWQLWPGTRTQATAISAYSGLNLPWTADGAGRCADLISRPTASLLLPVPGPMAIAPVVDWFTAPTTTQPSRANGNAVNSEMVTVLADRVRQLRHLDDVQGGPILLDWIKYDLRWTASLASTASYDRETGTALFRVLAQLAQLAGWVATDLGQQALGQRYLLAALRFAHAAADTELAAAVVSCLSYLALWMNSPANAVRLIRMARQRSAGHASPVTAALLASREARAHASSGSTAECAQALDEAANLLSTQAASPVPPPSWTYWVTEAVLLADAGRSWLEAGRPEQAIPLLDDGLRLFGHSQPRNRLLHGVSLAQAMLLTRQPDGAVQATDQALALTAGQDSGRVRTRLAELRTALAASTASQAIEAADRVADRIHA
ncbi:hypothetical protein FDG2_4080 [Candidatus Protofrankia californiensis]|uniref:XRE family transcriptional regulator n=1 Tax=Candidatus Protofrankia californiensis TaxID=1839754 RepID=A0A1C3P369_9ACTN|nr:hypothetical protein FDG2_4080 [Candidatus Protofrankia californiensis]